MAWKTILTTILTILIFIPIHAQLTDDFSDGNLNSDPEWLGQTSLFTVTDGELQLNAPAETSTSYLYLQAATSLQENTVWEFKVRLEFKPSTSNFGRIYLSSSSPNLLESLNGYFIQIGGISGDNDAVELFRQDGSSNTLLISGTAGGAGDNPELGIRVSRNTNGEWTLEVDYTGGTNYQMEGNANDTMHDTGGFFGVYCKYTSTRSTLFFFDNILIDPLFIDMEPPILTAVEAIDATTVKVTFNEVIDETSAAMAGNFSINLGIGNPISSNLDPSDPTSVLLNLAAPLNNLQEYVLTIAIISDVSGNVNFDLMAGFSFFQADTPLENEIIVTEIMADPNPRIGLPEAEFIELHNPTNKVFDLGGIGISTGSSPKLLSSFTLLPGDYLIICDDSFEAEFEAFGPVLSLSSFPALTNGGDEVTITDASGQVIYSVQYTDDWYQDPDKVDGGWSLEMIQNRRSL